VTALPVVARVFPPHCDLPGCQHHYYRPRTGCVCVAWPAGRKGVHVAVNPLCQAHHTVQDIIEDAADVLAFRFDYLDPDAEEIPEDVVSELAELWRAGPCQTCPGWGNPDALAEHFMARKQREWERSLPTWRCDCGAVYKPLDELGCQGFYAVAQDGTLGERVGEIRRNTKGVVKHSGACPGCGRRLADTIARRADPQLSLF
jgi:hypothetical protein